MTSGKVNKIGKLLKCLDVGDSKKFLEKCSNSYLRVKDDYSVTNDLISALFSDNPENGRIRCDIVSSLFEKKIISKGCFTKEFLFDFFKNKCRTRHNEDCMMNSILSTSKTSPVDPEFAVTCCRCPINYNILIANQLVHFFSSKFWQKLTVTIGERTFNVFHAVIESSMDRHYIAYFCKKFVEHEVDLKAGTRIPNSSVETTSSSSTRAIKIPRVLNAIQLLICRGYYSVLQEITKKHGPINVHDYNVTDIKIKNGTIFTRVLYSCFNFFLGDCNSVHIIKEMLKFGMANGLDPYTQTAGKCVFDCVRPKSYHDIIGYRNRIMRLFQDHYPNLSTDILEMCIKIDKFIRKNKTILSLITATHQVFELEAMIENLYDKMVAENPDNDDCIELIVQVFDDQDYLGCCYYPTPAYKLKQELKNKKLKIDEHRKLRLTGRISCSGLVTTIPDIPDYPDSSSDSSSGSSSGSESSSDSESD